MGKNQQRNIRRQAALERRQNDINRYLDRLSKNKKATKEDQKSLNRSLEIAKNDVENLIEKLK